MKVCEVLSVYAYTPDLIRLHEELDKLTANHSELPGLEVIQLQPCVQLTAGLIKVQQPPHKPATQQKHKEVFKTRSQRSTRLFINQMGFDDKVTLPVHLFIFVVPEVYVWPLGEEKNI